MSVTRHPARGTELAGWRGFGLWVAGALTVRGAAAWLLAGVLASLAAGEIALDGRTVYAPAAMALVAGEGYVIDGTPVASHVPGYPLLLALALAVTPSLDAAVLTVQVGGGALAVGLIFWLGTLLFGVRVGHVAAALALVFPDLIAYSLLNLSETPQLLCVIAAAAYTVRVLRGAPAWSAATLGLALGLGTLMRESTVLFAGTWWVLLLAVPWAPPRVRAARVALAAVVFVAVLAPWWLRNGHTFEEFVPLSAKGMKNVYLGTLIRPYPVTDYRNQDVVVDPAELARARDVNRRAEVATTLAERDASFSRPRATTCAATRPASCCTWGGSSCSYGRPTSPRVMRSASGCCWCSGGWRPLTSLCSAWASSVCGAVGGIATPQSCCSPLSCSTRSSTCWSVSRSPVTTSRCCRPC